jgi:DNA-binding PadR family transcriptional regulator
MLRFLLLGVLNYSAMNGYEMKQFIDSSTAHFWHAKLSQIYTTLKALEEEGLLHSHVEPQEDRPDRRIYTITDAGRLSLRQWLEQPMTELEPSKEPLLLKLFFSAQVDKDTILAQLYVQRALFQKMLELYRGEVAERIRQSVEQTPELAKDALLWDATRRLGELSTEVYVRWLDETIAMIRDKF